MTSIKLKSILVGGAEFQRIQVPELKEFYESQNYIPNTPAEEKYMSNVKKAFEENLPDFFVPTMNPSFKGDDESKEGSVFCYKPGKEPVDCCSFNYAMLNAHKYAPELRSRLGTKLEYEVFLAMLGMKLVESGKTMAWAMNAICNDSTELGNYSNSINATKFTLEVTGSRDVCGFKDLGSTRKMLADEGSGQIWLGGGDSTHRGYVRPLAWVGECETRHLGCDFCSPWIVFPAND